jgi:hypothetical protein
MSGYAALSDLGWTLRPIDKWPSEQTRRRLRSPFGSSLASTCETLARELRALNAKHIVVQVAVREQDFRIDGGIRANARPPEHPGVIVAFESKHGPIKFAVDKYLDWEDNLRAVALGMEALRKVDRYGVTKRGEQYTGWRAIPRTTDPADSVQTREQAQEILAPWGGDWRQAARATHPDTGGDPDAFRRVMRAKELIGS